MPTLITRRRQMLDTDFPADGIPFLRVDLGPNALATFLKVPWKIDDATVTTWHEHFLEEVDDCWNDPSHFDFDPERPWVKSYLATVRRVARDAAGGAAGSCLRCGYSSRDAQP